MGTELRFHTTGPRCQLSQSRFVTASFPEETFEGLKKTNTREATVTSWGSSHLGFIIL